MISKAKLFHPRQTEKMQQQWKMKQNKFSAKKYRRVHCVFFEHFGLLTPKNILLKRSFIYMQQAELITVGDGSPVPKADSEKAVIILQG